MTCCAERQRDPTTREHHLAASYLFLLERRATIFATHVPLTIACLIPVLVATTGSSGVESWAAAISGAVALIARVAAKPIATRSHRRGVEELEARDCHIFDLPWNHGLGERPQRESTKLRSDRATAALPEEASQVATWYEFGDTVPDDVNVLIAQRSNLAWGENAHEHWANILVVALVLVVALGVAASTVADHPMATYLGVVAFPSVVGWIETWDLQSAHRRASADKADRRRKVEDAVERRNTAQAREFQDDVFRSRLNHPHVPNWFHRLRRDRDDAAMRSAAHDLAQP